MLTEGMTHTKAEIECKNFKKYLGIWKPRCSCLACRDKFIDILVEREQCNKTE